MSSSSAALVVKRAALVFPIAITAFLLFFGLGSFGLWEPHETDRTDLVAAHVEGDDPADATARVGPGFHLGERLAALSWSLLGRSEATARLPSAILAFLSVLVLYLGALRLTGPRIAIYAALVFSSAPALLLHGRQLTSGAPLLFGETSALVGLALIAFDTGRRSAWIGAALALLGLVAGWLAAGLLIGVAAPAAAILAALAVNGDLLAVFSSEARPPIRRQALVFTAGPLLLLALGTFWAIAAGDTPDVPLVTGGLAAGPLKARSFDYGLSLLANGWYPWSAIAPIALVGFLRPATDEDDPHRPLKVLAVCYLVTGFLAHNAFTALHGPSPLFLAMPLALTAALAIEHLERSRFQHAMAGLFSAALLAILIRDFAQSPGAILAALAWDGIPLPKDFKPVIAAGIAAAPFALLLVLSTFLGAGEPGSSRWRPWRAAALVPLAAVAIGGYVGFGLVPGLSVDLSSRHVVESYKRFTEEGAPLAVLGARPPMEAEKLKTESDLLDWLRRDERAFAMFPPAKLASIDRAYRQKEGRHVFVLDAESERFMLATSAPRKGEQNRNPLAAYVLSEPFDPPPPRQKRVNFDDKITLLGWDLRSEDGQPYLEQGKEFELTSYWRSEANVNRDYKVFIHIDGAGPRIHGDHMPVKDLFPTREWRPGDYIKDVYKGDVPLYQAKGRYRIRIGLYKGNTRMKVVDDPSATENAVALGHVELK